MFCNVIRKSDNSDFLKREYVVHLPSCSALVKSEKVWFLFIPLWGGKSSTSINFDHPSLVHNPSDKPVRFFGYGCTTSALGLENMHRELFGSFHNFISLIETPCIKIVDVEYYNEQN
jgi:hypothetical protein